MKGTRYRECAHKPGGDVDNRGYGSCRAGFLAVARHESDAACMARRHRQAVGFADRFVRNPK